ncbi:DNA adenine methylase [Chryseobacterium nematophagum]|uniref:site-specific DNA-methyltransferase (adenine-specific) n=1 Tax=Chryseobacterium nematophagum TaxID=2305228 RepID=A0A3M7L876_9FLAO|nr:DNA adenine methylase [Chryseobacterium nematophagum]RMZ58953.1 DNA adenine methylase [Chryseobacterium nematophagum]
MKNYTQAPLPFQGQKRRFLKQFKEALKEFSPTATYVDLFGGSGLLSHTVKNVYPNANVIYNDFDNYSQRLKNIDKTNALLSDIRKICIDNTNDIRKEKLSEELQGKIINRISEEKAYVDWITISSSLLFSMNYVTSFDQLKKERFYNKIRLSNYEAEGYLKGVNRVRKDYQDLVNEYKNKSNVVFLVDPPYLSTDTATYSRLDYWKLTDYLNVLKSFQDTSYFYFTSNKSQIIELCEWMQDNGYCKNPFEAAITVKAGTHVTHNASYTDIMMYRNNAEKV